MIPKAIRTFWTEDRAAISPLYAVGILALVGVSGVGFDYGRLMALDSELQNAADQAALAAATQLDGGDDAMIRARDAANNALASAASPFVNETRFANDARLNTGMTNTRPITSLSFTFYNGYSSDAVGDVVADDADGAQAEVVEVTVNARQVFYALTPVVGAMSSGNVIGKAMAALETGTCNVPPMMFCLPNRPIADGGGTDTSFPTSADIGKGVYLHPNANAADPWAPGNFGFLDIDYDSNGNHNLGLNSDFSGCAGEAVESQTGDRQAEAHALNTRFDMYEQSGNNLACDAAGNGDFCPAENVRRDFVSVQSFNNMTSIEEIEAIACDASPAGNTWRRYEDLPEDADVLPPPQGLPRDNCFVSGGCAIFGDTPASVAAPNWAAAAYMTAHHGTTEFSTASPNGTRYEVYKWEIVNKNAVPDPALPSPVRVGYDATLNENNGKYAGEIYCAYPQPINNNGRPASNTQKDRRVLTVAAVDCTGLNGGDVVRILRWVDLFLVEPAGQTGSEKEFFTEIIGPAKKPNGEYGFQHFSRKKAVLIR